MSADTAVGDLYARLLDSWNRRDAEGYAALFASDAAMIGFDGSQVAGSQILDHLLPIFADHPTASYVSKVRGIRPLSANACVLCAIVGMVPAGQQQLDLPSTPFRRSWPSSTQAAGGSCCCRTRPRNITADRSSRSNTQPSYRSCWQANSRPVEPRRLSSSIASEHDSARHGCRDRQVMHRTGLRRRQSL